MSKPFLSFSAGLAALTACVCGLAAEPAPDARVVVMGERDAEWGSYRYAYKAGAMFAAITRSRPLIQAHMQVRPIEKSASLEGLTIQLAGARTSMMLPVDAIGRVNVPLLKEPYQDDAVLRLNRGKGLYYFSGRFSVRERDDGIYPLADLRTACDQMLSAQRESGYRIRLIGKRCVGVRFVYRLSEVLSPVSLQSAGAAPVMLPLVEGQPFEGTGMGTYKTAIYRFADWPDAGQLLAGRRPLAIGTLYE